MKRVQYDCAHENTEAALRPQENRRHEPIGAGAGAVIVAVGVVLQAGEVVAARCGGRFRLAP
jgi:precorrin-6B methylase 2